MWTKENRGRYDRSRLRYPSDLTDEEWALAEPLIAPAKRGGNKRTVDVREVVNGLMYVLSTGCQWPEPSPSAAIIDSQSVKSAWIDPHGYDAGKKIKGKKRHILAYQGRPPGSAGEAAEV